jgi:hypothetical protein
MLSENLAVSQVIQQKPDTVARGSLRGLFSYGGLKSLVRARRWLVRSAQIDALQMP